MKPQYNKIVAGILCLLARPSFAQQMEGMMGKGESCAMGSAGMVLFGGVGVAAIAALLALTYFLVKKSRA